MFEISLISRLAFMRLPFVRLHLGRFDWVYSVGSLLSLPLLPVARKACTGDQNDPEEFRLLKDTMEDIGAKFPAPVFQLPAFFTSFSAALVLQAGEDYISVPVSAESWQWSVRWTLEETRRCCKRCCFQCWGLRCANGGLFLTIACFPFPLLDDSTVFKLEKALL